MAEHKTKDGVLTDADLAAYGIPPKQPVEPTKVKSHATMTRKKDKMMKPSTLDRAEGKLREVKGTQSTCFMKGVTVEATR